MARRLPLLAVLGSILFVGACGSDEVTPALDGAVGSGGTITGSGGGTGSGGVTGSGGSTAPCTDEYPYVDGYTCPQQAAWGKCAETWLAGYCNLSCERCTPSGSGGAIWDGGVGGAGGKIPVCDFASGLNVAWVSFASDVPNPNIAAFNTLFKNTHDAGGRVVRWWFHTNGTMTPGYDANGMVKPLLQSHVDGVKQILNAAYSNGVRVVISLWSFDMLQENAGTAWTKNSALLENDTVRQSYIDNYLKPLVMALSGTPGLYAYEIFNEPEGMSPTGWATHRTTMAAIQKCVNWWADAIHTTDPNVPVTNGAQTFDYCSTVKTNYYSDAALRAAGGRENGTLDFYQVHYYASNGVSNSPFKQKASYWGLDKSLVIGEFASQDTDGVLKDNLYSYLYDNGYKGAWAWAYDSDWPWPSMQVPMQTLYNAHTGEIGACF